MAKRHFPYWKLTAILREHADFDVEFPFPYGYCSDEIAPWFVHYEILEAHYVEVMESIFGNRWDDVISTYIPAYVDGTVEIDAFHCLKAIRENFTVSEIKKLVKAKHVLPYNE